LACYYRKRNQLRIALINLEKALEIESNLDAYFPTSQELFWTHEDREEHQYTLTEDRVANKLSATQKAETHLNTCAVLSQMKRHDIALTHAQ
jgi:hypothetical protein